MLKVKIKKLNEDAITPSRGSEQAAGYDLNALTYVCIQPGETVMVHTGLSVEIPEGYFGAIYARSGLASKQGLRPANCVGVVDSDYRGEVCVALHNDSDEERIINSGTRVAQLVIQKYEAIEFVEESELSETERGEKGFGSTDKK